MSSISFKTSMIPVTLLFCTLILLPCVVKANDRNLKTYINVHTGVTCFKCGPGSFVSRHCTENFSYSDCDPCPLNTFQTNYTQTGKCAPCTPQCIHDLNMVIVKECTAISDIKCECKPGYYLRVKDDYFKIYVCTEHSLCPKGQVIKKKGTSTSDNECGYCPDGQFYSIHGQCETCTICTDQNMTQLAPCSPTVDTVCGDNLRPAVNDTTATDLTTVPDELDVNIKDGTDIFPILGPVLVLISFVIVAVYLIYRHFNIPSGTLDIGSIESLGKTVPSDVISTCEKNPLLPISSKSNSCKRQRTFSGSSVVSVRSVSVFLDITDPELWKRDVFDLLAQRLVNWKRFVRLLPGNLDYRHTVTSRCEQIQEEQRHYVPEQIHAALTEWAQRNEGKFVKIDSILDTLDKMSLEDPQCGTLYTDVCSMCCKLANEEKQSYG